MPLYQKSTKGIVYVALYIDDNLMISNNAMIDDTILALKHRGLVLKIVDELQGYLSCKSKFLKIKNVPGWDSPI